MDTNKSFRLIVNEFKKNVAEFIEKNGLDKHSIQVHLNEERPSGRIEKMNGELLENCAFFYDAHFLLVTPIKN